MATKEARCSKNSVIPTVARALSTTAKDDHKTLAPLFFRPLKPLIEFLRLKLNLQNFHFNFGLFWHPWRRSTLVVPLSFLPSSLTSTTLSTPSFSLSVNFCTVHRLDTRCSFFFFFNNYCLIKKYISLCCDLVVYFI